MIYTNHLFLLGKGIKEYTILGTLGWDGRGRKYLLFCWDRHLERCQMEAGEEGGSIKVNCTLVQALRLCTGRTAHRGSRGIALPFS